MADVLFCTDTFWAEYGEQVTAIAPDLDTVLLTEGQRPSETDLERITIAFFSHDAWPERASSFIGAAMRAPNLTWMHSMSAGVDSPVFQMLMDQGIRLTNSSGTSSAPIARTVLMYLLALTRSLPKLMAAQAKGEWSWHSWDELDGRRVAVVGFGPIGQEVVRLTTAVGMEPVIVRRAALGDEPCDTKSLSELRAVASTVDAMVIALPLNDDTRGLISAEILAALPDHAFFINVGRGELVDQDALIDALSGGRLGGAGLDVTDPEPLPPDSALWTLPNVIVTPHNSGNTSGTKHRAALRFLANLECWVERGELPDEVT